MNPDTETLGLDSAQPMGNKLTRDAPRIDNTIQQIIITLRHRTSQKSRSIYASISYLLGLFFSNKDKTQELIQISISHLGFILLNKGKLKNQLNQYQSSRLYSFQ